MPVFSQSADDTLVARIDPAKYAAQVSEKVSSLEDKLVKKSVKTLEKLQMSEEKIYNKLLKGKDSLIAKSKLAEVKIKYASMKEAITKPAILEKAKQYIPKLDSLSTSLKFLHENSAGGKVKDALVKVSSLQGKLDKAEDIKAFIKERRELLKQQLEKLGMLKELKKINKQVYYYAAQIKEYKELLKDSKKLERKTLELLSKTKLFKDFMRKNGMLASFFPMPGGGLDSRTAQTGFAGLQTRSQLNTYLVQTGMTTANPVSQLQGNIQDVQSTIGQLRNKVNQLTGGSNTLDMPDFKPNNQKTKSFLQRLEYGTSFQSQKADRFFPTTSDIGLSVGYKLNDKSIVGIAASYKVGWGRGFDQIRITHQGMGLRSFFDWKIKGSLWITGGYEQNYRTLFNSIEQLRNLSAWQQSGLLGISKNISLKTKILKQTKLQLLWDFLSYQQLPRTQPLVFRVGYSF